ncbi:transglycosylase SLT domain-containing protein [Thalassotalea piscium]|uniref:Transglycosylase SLT domain-containing protein n=1 Tax=Thalassotalea piscium TaxID=1230533 RepID=A0A7X0NKI5_9GAMM|nr:transglycosylase SLT domain-containing protein [Thalassotalea piscium]MBB6545139.1 hypothetical protein [Thalassotalea piscium]
MMYIVNHSIKYLRYGVVIIGTLFGCVASGASIEDYIPPFNVWLEASNQNSRSASLIYSVALVESGKYTNEKKFVPWPFAIGVGVDKSLGQLTHESIYPETFEEAKHTLTQLLANGYTNIGVGIMQINIRHNKHLVEDPIHLLDPVTNIKAASKVIKQCNKNKSATQMLSCYSHGRYDSKRGAIYANRVFDYEARFAKSFINKHQPSGEISLAELNYFYYNKKPPSNELISKEQTQIVERE